MTINSINFVVDGIILTGYDEAKRHGSDPDRVDGWTDQDYSILASDLKELSADTEGGEQLNISLSTSEHILQIGTCPSDTAPAYQHILPLSDAIDPENLAKAIGSYRANQEAMRSKGPGAQETTGMQRRADHNVICQDLWDCFKNLKNPSIDVPDNVTRGIAGIIRGHYSYTFQGYDPSAIPFSADTHPADATPV